MSEKESTLIILFFSFLMTSVISSSTEKVNIEMRLTYLETELSSTKASLMEILKSISILSKEYVHKNDIEGLLNLQNNSHTEEELDIKFMSLNEQINDSKSKLTDIVQNAVDSLEKKFVVLKDDLSHKLDKKVKREHGSKYVTEDNFERVSKQVEKLQGIPLNISKTFSEISQDLTIAKITRNEFAKFQLTVARDTAGIKFQEGEWVIFQKRGQYKNPADYFSRNMAEYVTGFGNPSMEFWLGLDKLASLTQTGAELLVELETFEGKKIRAKYRSFKVSGGPEYRLHVSGYSGNAGNPLRIDNGMAFSARDSDRDRWEGDCSQTRGGGGWWYNGCGLTNLNGRNLGAGEAGYDGILWYLYAKDNRSFKSTKMMMRKTRGELL